MLLISCGSDTNKKVSNSSKELADASSDPSSIIKEETPSKTIDTMAVANTIETLQEEEVEESFNPPHIPVFKKEKKRKSKPTQKEETIKPKSTTKKKNSTMTSDVVKTDVAPKAKKSTENVKTVPKTRSSSKGKDTEIVWRRNFYSFGDIIQGDTVYFKFEFTNVGEHPLLIEDAKSSCGCTHPSYSFLPIAPNEKGEIKGMYVSDTKEGTQNANIIITANTEPRKHKLYIDGKVLLPENNAENSDTEEGK